MRAARKFRRFSAFAVLVIGAVLSLGAQGFATAATSHPAAASSQAGSASAAIAHPGTIKPHAVGELDCNGLSPIQRPVKPAVMCQDPRGSWGGRFYENGHYIGHDEPSVRFLSSQPGSGNNFSMTETLPRDPRQAAGGQDPWTGQDALV
jgi:hypothetical protein